MAYCVISTPAGNLTAFEEDGHLVALEWGTPPPGAAKTPVLTLLSTQLLSYFAGTLRQFDLPLAISGTAFQRRVYAEIAAIPYGTTRRYGEIANRLGTGARAVGAACGSNPLPIVIPCHRVVGGNGVLGGYSGGDGLATKRQLLALEQGLGFG